MDSLNPLSIEPQISEEEYVLGYAKYIQAQYFGNKDCILKVKIENRWYTVNTRTKEITKENWIIRSYKKWLYELRGSCKQ